VVAGASSFRECHDLQRQSFAAWTDHDPAQTSPRSCATVRIHKTLRTTPAMAARVTERLWEISDIVNVLEAWEAAK
jgi:hypothetical protein